MSKLINLERKKFGMLTILRFSHKNKGGQSYWKCLCECGKTKIIRGASLKRGHTKSCGCLHRKSFIGKIFSRLIVISFSHVAHRGRLYWNCLCDCGKTKIIAGPALKCGNTKSCGCLQKETVSSLFTKHGMSKTPIYYSWLSMIQRCYYQKHKFYKNYGGRGIKVCKRWRNSFINFYKDMGDKPKGKSIDRINNNGDYKPKNCKWSTAIEQQNNTRSNRKLKIKGKTHTMAEWGCIKKINSYVICDRLKMGWTSEKAVLTKVRKMSNNVGFTMSEKI